MASLLKRDIKTRLILRDPDKAFSLFGEQDEQRLKVPASVWFISSSFLFLRLFLVVS